MTVPVAVTVPPLPPLGGDTVTFITLDRSGPPDAMGTVTPTRVRVDVQGCRHRPVQATTPTQRETPVEITDVGVQVWQTHAPPVDAALNADLTGEMEVNGVTYQILGGPAKVTGDDGAVLFVKILSKVQEG